MYSDRPITDLNVQVFTDHSFYHYHYRYRYCYHYRYR